MNRILHGLYWRMLLLYLDDIIVIAMDFDTNLHRLGDVVQRLYKIGLKLKPSKCELLQPQVCYLGHIVSQGGVSMVPDKVKAVTEWLNPRRVKELQGFLGTVGYYRQYIQEFATIAHPLHWLTAKGESCRWTEGEQIAFNKLKDSISTTPLLGYPDPWRQYILDTDASGCGVGAVLSQIQECCERVIAYYSKTLTLLERDYCVTR
ncbi:uncharacterized protein [Watersipora subatra]|uniref:uncharacterized protein n=1 Tax=Watersipora subatra TaxID=2589382 RepID=UPI00355B1827